MFIVVKNKVKAIWQKSDEVCTYIFKNKYKKYVKGQLKISTGIYFLLYFCWVLLLFYR